MKLFQYVIASLLIHFLFWGGLKSLPQGLVQPATDTVEISILDQPPAQRKFVTDPNMDKLEESLNQLEKKVKFLSKNTRRVKREQVARRTGKTANRQLQQPKRQQQQKWDPPTINGPGISAKQELRKMEKEVRLSESTISEFIPEVRQGGFTSLNTDQFMFYTFYARINEQIRNRWVSNIREFADMTPQSILNNITQKRQLTQLEVILSPEGEYIKTIIHKKSESHGLDMAAAQAFLDANPFNNPPLEIVSEDGYIHLHYAFYVQWRPNAFARRPAQ